MAVKTNERPGTRAVLRYSRMSSYKVREVLDLVRGMELSRALEILDHTERAAAEVVAKLVRSAAANAEHNEGIDPEELYIATAYADEGATLKRWRPRARGRATRIRKRTCHITVVLARMPDDKIARRRARTAAEATQRRARRVAGTRRTAAGSETPARSRAVVDPNSGLAVDVTDELDEPTDVMTSDVLTVDLADAAGGDAVEDADGATDEDVTVADDGATNADDEVTGADAPGEDED
jgi:large subunit ribosomal protein L22